MTQDDLPPHLRETDRNRPAPVLELPLEEDRPPAPPPAEEKDARDGNPFLRAAARDAAGSAGGTPAFR